MTGRENQGSAGTPDLLRMAEKALAQERRLSAALMDHTPARDYFKDWGETWVSTTKAPLRARARRRRCRSHWAARNIRTGQTACPTLTYSLPAPDSAQHNQDRSGSSFPERDSGKEES